MSEEHWIYPVEREFQKLKPNGVDHHFMKIELIPHKSRLHLCTGNEGETHRGTYLCQIPADARRIMKEFMKEYEEGKREDYNFNEERNQFEDR